VQTKSVQELSLGMLVSGVRPASPPPAIEAYIPQDAYYFLLIPDVATTRWWRFFTLYFHFFAIFFEMI
jgi:hypothetical protein